MAWVLHVVVTKGDLVRSFMGTPEGHSGKGLELKGVKSVLKAATKREYVQIFRFESIRQSVTEDKVRRLQSESIRLQNNLGWYQLAITNSAL